MSVVWLDGFEHLPTTSSSGKFSYVNNATVLGSATTQHGYGQSAQIVASSLRGSVGISVTPTTNQGVAGFWWMRNSIDVGFNDWAAVLVIGSPGGWQFGLFHRTDGTLLLGRTSSGSWPSSTEATTAAGYLAENTWYYVEFKFKIANSIAGGDVVVRLNGTEIFNLDAGRDTRQYSGSDLISTFQVGIARQSSLANVHIDDLYITDGTEFLGSTPRVITLMPSGAGSSAQFTPSAGSNFENIDESPRDDDTTYNESSTVGHIDTFAVESPPVSVGVVHSIGVNVAARYNSSANSLATRIVSGASAGAGSAVALGTGYSILQTIHNTDPDTASAWTPSAVDSIEAGYRLES